MFFLQIPFLIYVPNIVIHLFCYIAKLGNEDEDKLSVLSDLESILTFHCKSDKRRKYNQKNGWTDLLFPLIALKLPRSDTYGLFEAISNKFIPRNNDAYHLLRLIILYHDPELCNLLDTKKITTDLFAAPWVSTLTLVSEAFPCRFICRKFLKPTFRTCS